MMSSDEHILSSLEEVKCEIRTLHQLVHSFVQSEMCDLPEGVELSLKCMEELDRMEGLLDYEKVKKQLVGIICSISGIVVSCSFIMMIHSSHHVLCWHLLDRQFNPKEKLTVHTSVTDHIYL